MGVRPSNRASWRLGSSLKKARRLQALFSQAYLGLKIRVYGAQHDRGKRRSHSVSGSQQVTSFPAVGNATQAGVGHDQDNIGALASSYARDARLAQCDRLEIGCDRRKGLGDLPLDIGGKTGKMQSSCENQNPMWSLSKPRPQMNIPLDKRSTTISTTIGVRHSYLVSTIL